MTASVTSHPAECERGARARAAPDVDPEVGCGYDLPVMSPKVLSDILQRYGAGVREGESMRFDKNTDVTVFASLGQEALTVARVVEMTIAADALVITTVRQERYVLFYEDVRGIRFAPLKENKPAFL
jgi:hypothetical protein